MNTVGNDSVEFLAPNRNLCNVRMLLIFHSKHFFLDATAVHIVAIIRLDHFEKLSGGSKIEHGL